MPQESLTITIKKSAELYVVGGVAEKEDNTLAFWYGVRKYPVMPRHLQEETGTKSKTEYVQKFRPPFEEPEKYRDFYKGLPEVFEEGKPEAVERYKPVLAPSTVIIEPTAIEYSKQPTGDPSKDVPVVVEIIKKIRQLIWRYPVSGEFTSLTGLQGPELREFINTNIIKQAMKKTARLKIIPETVRYISVATGQVFTSESQVKSAIEEYHREPMAVAASNKGGLKMNSVGELLKIADMLDERGALKEADEILEVVKQMVPTQDSEVCVECEDHKEANAKVAKIVSTLVKIADSLESKGAFKEAQMADTILQDLKNDIGLPQAFKTPFTDKPVVPAAPAAESAPTATVVEPTQQEVQETKSPSTPFSQLPESKTEQPTDGAPKAVAVEPVKQQQPTFDELTLDEFNTLIDGMRYRHSQGKQRTKYEKIREVATRAQEYKNAYEEWLGHAHKLFEDEPIRLKI